MTVAHYRALNLDGDIKKGICTEGTFASVSDLEKRIIKRGIDNGEVLRIEREHNGKWIFERNIAIPDFTD